VSDGALALALALAARLRAGGDAARRGAARRGAAHSRLLHLGLRR
jgi:hypothetical protein